VQIVRVVTGTTAGGLFEDTTLTENGFHHAVKSDQGVCTGLFRPPDVDRLEYAADTRRRVVPVASTSHHPLHS